MSPAIDRWGSDREVHFGITESRSPLDYYVLSRLIEPFALLALLHLLALVRLGWGRAQGAERPGYRAVFATALLLYLSCSPLVAHWAESTLTQFAPVEVDASKLPPHLVVLAGGLNGQQKKRLSSYSLDRCLAAYNVYRDRRCRIYASGGHVPVNEPQGKPEAVYMAEFLRDLGVHPRDLELETRSTTTYENAVETAQLLKARGVEEIALVTDTIHLYRSRLCFESQGIQVREVPATPVSTSFSFQIRDLIPSPGAAKTLNRVAHEWLGVLWYRWKGRI